MQDKTEAATPRRREEARKRGNVAKSMELNSALVLLISLLVLRIAGPFMLQTTAGLLRDTFGSLNERVVSSETMLSLVMLYGSRSLLICLPILLAAGAIGLSVNVLQIGFRASTMAMTPDLNRLDPLKGMAKLFSWRGMIELVKSLLKVGAVTWVVYAFLRDEFRNMPKLSDMPVQASASVIGVLCWRMLGRACAVMLVIAILDFIYQRYQYEIGLRMTKQEVKDEYKLQEGDPQTRARIRQRQRQIARQRMMQSVPKADVIVTNPTHVAVAIMYDADKMAAPTVVAKGQRLIARKIREIAEAHGIPIVENPPVARMLYQMVEVGGQIPEQLYQAVAEILAFVYRLSEKAVRRGSPQAGKIHRMGSR